MFSSVIGASFLGMISLLLGLAAVQPAAVQSVTRLVVQDEVILRVPVERRPLMPAIEWRERKGPRCIPAGAVRGALLSGPEQVDFVLADRSRMRAQFDEDCLGLDFYEGVYLQTEDDRVCARRDAIRSRMGTTCRIERFKRLVPKFQH
jgi:hypothetical protein